MKKILYISFTLLVMMHCDSYSQKMSIDVLYLKYKNGINVTAGNGFMIDSLSVTGDRFYQYYESDSSLIFRLEIKNGFDTSILINGIVAKKIKEKAFEVEDYSLVIKKYYYDIDYQHDEEFYLFINHSVGIIAINYFPWGLIMIPQSVLVNNCLVDSLLYNSHNFFHE